MFEITGVGTFLLSLAATVGATVASVKLGPRLVSRGAGPSWECSAAWASSSCLGCSAW